MTELSRRTLLKGGAASAVGLAIAGPFQGFAAHAQNGAKSDGYGPLGPVEDLRGGVVRLELPDGFQYRSFHPRGTVLADGAVLPGRHDGMATFPGPNGRTILVRNHEINGNLGPGGGTELVLGVPTAGYDPIAKGGTVTVDVDGQGNVFDDFVSLSGTQMNCAGGPTPWSSWLTCEETVNGSDVGPDFTGVPNNTLLKHGYVFEVPVGGISSAEPITSAGRFAHEAVVPHPSGRVLYLTEDNFGFPSGFYRYLIPNRPHEDGFVANGGRLQMLAVRGQPNAPLHLGQPAGASYRVRWIDIDDPDPTFAPGTTNNQAIVAVGDQGRAQGAALFSRLEGCVWDAGRVFFTSTQGGSASDAVNNGGFGNGRGQVWSYHPGAERLDLVVESSASSELDLPDNVARSRTGTLVLCEDGLGLPADPDNFLRGLTRRGELFRFAHNVDPTQAGQEFAGARFSPDFRTLFVNIQSSSGYSIAIWGPWHKGPFG
jgi:secreted PhoX family phosphatase